MDSIFSNPIFGIIISVISFEIGSFIYKKTKIPFFNPLLIAVALIILFLKVFNIDLKDYNQGGNIINFFLSPSTVVLAIPLYKKIHLLKKDIIPIIAGISIGSISGILSVIYLCKLFNLNTEISVSMMPKSITTPIGIEISKQLGGIPPVTVAVIIITGIIGAIVGPSICKTFRIKDSVAIGISLGTASHAIGTTKAMEIGEVEGAMSGLAIGIAGLFTVFLAPILFKLIM